MTAVHTVTKSYRDLPAAHRQPKHDGHCRLIHGHNWGFDITFACDRLDECGFVVDVGKLHHVKKFLEDMFDHTLLLNNDDGGIPRNSETEAWLADFATIFRVPNCSMEGLAELVFYEVMSYIPVLTECSDPMDNRRGLRVLSVTCWEDSKNSATYCQ